MTQQTTADVLQEFQAELDKTAVLSESFKSWLSGQMMNMATVAHKQGYNEGLKEERKSREGKRDG